MLKPLIALSIAPSDWQLASHGLLLGLGVVIIGACLGALVASIGCLVGGAWLWHERAHALCGTLEVSVMQTGIQGRFRPTHGSAVETWELLRCDYLGPWLIGLRLGKRRLWLWPDSASAEVLRRVRCLFHHPGRG
jgi:toxin CptA